MFFIDCETHLWPPMDDIVYYPNFQIYLKSINNLAKVVGSPPRAVTGPIATSEALLHSMDEGEIAKACVLPEICLEFSHGHRARSTNGFIAIEAEKHPDRFIPVANVGPMSKRTAEEAVWELKYLVKERGFKACKILPPEDCPINDRRMWPLYEAINELKIPVFIHTGMAFILPGHSSYCHPMLLEDVIISFPDMPIVAYHFGYPYYRELILLAGRSENLYIGTSLLPQLTRVAHSPTLFGEVIGEAMAYAGSDKLIWGTDWSGPLVSHKVSSDLVRNFQIPEEVQKRCGYLPLTEEDRRKWAGENLAKLLSLIIREGDG